MNLCQCFFNIKLIFLATMYDLVEIVYERKNISALWCHLILTLLKRLHRPKTFNVKSVRVFYLPLPFHIRMLLSVDLQSWKKTRQTKQINEYREITLESHVLYNYYFKNLCIIWIVYKCMSFVILYICCGEHRLYAALLALDYQFWTAPITHIYFVDATDAG